MKTFHIQNYYVPASAVAFIKEPTTRIGTWSLVTIDGSTFPLTNEAVLNQVKSYFGIDTTK